MNGSPPGSRADRGHWPAPSLMAALTDAERAALLDCGARMDFRNRQIVVLQGEVGDELYVLTGGVVKVIVAAENGTETMLAIRSRGDLIGEFALLDGKPRVATARAVGTVGTIRISRSCFESFGEKYPAARETLMRSLVAKMRDSTERHAQRTLSAKERLAQVILDLAIDYGEPQDDDSVIIPVQLTQSELGELADTAVSTTERHLAEFRAMGVVTTGYKEITVCDATVLRKLATTK